MIRNPKKFYAILFSLGLLALLVITAVFHAINAPIERDIADVHREIAAMIEQADAESTARLAEQLERIKPPVEYKGRLLVEGMVIRDGELTHYCACAKCNGAKYARITADGTALDDETAPIAGANWLPVQSVVEVDGVQYRIADRGENGGELEAVGRLDIYVPEGHQAALDAGRVKGAEIIIISLGGSEK